MKPRVLRALPALILPALLLTGCSGEAIDAFTAGEFQADVRRIADIAAAGDPAAAMTLARALEADVQGARTAGNVTEDRATVIVMHIDAVIAALETAEVQPEEVQAPTENSTPPPESP